MTVKIHVPTSPVASDIVPEMIRTPAVNPVNVTSPEDETARPETIELVRVNVTPDPSEPAVSN